MPLRMELVSGPFSSAQSAVTTLLLLQPVQKRTCSVPFAHSTCIYNPDPQPLARPASATLQTGCSAFAHVATRGLRSMSAIATRQFAALPAQTRSGHQSVKLPRSRHPCGTHRRLRRTPIALFRCGLIARRMANGCKAIAGPSPESGDSDEDWQHPAGPQSKEAKKRKPR
jgi:hypothetical protein